MRTKLPWAPAALVVGMSCLPPAQAVDPAALANTGSDNVVACAACHGADGGGLASFPRLAGMNANYLLKQLGDYDSGSRVNAVMQPIAKALSPEERIGITRYYAAMPIPRGQPAQSSSSAGPGSVGAELALFGNWSNGVPACVQCHGPRGAGVGDAFPAIAAQPAAYLADQLRAWQAGTRSNDPIELMRHLSAKLSEPEIQAVSEWFAMQPATAGRDLQ